CQYYYSTPLTF
nr:immunoglobulin light chain junction region [Macaca mulatta]